MVPQKKYDKAYWLTVAEMIDAFRIVPRVVLVLYSMLVYIVVTWFMGIPTPLTQHAALVTTVVGMAAVVIGLYQKSGRTWGDKLNITVKKDVLVDSNPEAFDDR